MGFCRICKIEYGTEKDLKFHRIPKNGDTKEKWFEIIGKVVPPSSVICSKHFSNDDYIINKDGSKKILKSCAIPQLNLPANMILGHICLTSNKLSSPKPVKNESDNALDSYDQFVEGHNNVLRSSNHSIGNKVSNVDVIYARNHISLEQGPAYARKRKGNDQSELILEVVPSRKSFIDTLHTTIQRNSLLKPAISTSVDIINSDAQFDKRPNSSVQISFNHSVDIEDSNLDISRHDHDLFEKGLVHTRKRKGSIHNESIIKISASKKPRIPRYLGDLTPEHFVRKEDFQVVKKYLVQQRINSKRIQKKASRWQHEIVHVTNLLSELTKKELLSSEVAQKIRLSLPNISYISMKCNS